MLGLGSSAGRAFAQAPSSTPPISPEGAPSGAPEDTAGSRGVVADATNGEPRVASVDVDLTVWRGGDRPTAEAGAGDEGRRIPRRRARVDGTATYELESSTDADRTLRLLDFAEFMAEEPRDLDEIALATYVAGASERARLELTGARVRLGDGSEVEVEVERVGGRRDLSVPVPAGAVAVTLDYRVELPHRYWPLGCVWRRCSLSGAIAPLPSEPARGGAWLPSEGRVVAPTRWTVSGARFGAVPDWVPGTEPSHDQDKGLRGQELVVTRETTNPDAPIAYPGVFWGPRWHHETIWHRGVEIRVLSITRRPGDRYPDESLLHPLRDIAGHVHAIAKESLDIASATGIEPAPDAQLTVVQGPLRTDVAQFHPTAVMVSDQYLELIATDRLAKFHDIQVARAVADLIAYGHFVGGRDGSVDLWLSSALGVGLAQLWQRQRELRDEFAADLLASFTFVPAIDHFLYSGQAAFSSAYFRGSEDKMPVRYHPLYFAHELPTGRRIHEKLVDLIGEQALADFYTAAVADPGQDPVHLAEQAWGRELGWFFDQWLGPYPDVDYAIADVRSTKGADGRWRHEIDIVRDGEHAVIEPVQVYVAERGGGDHYLVWNGEAAPGESLLDQPAWHRHTFVLETDGDLEVVRLDPRSRLTQVSRVPVGRFNRGDNNDPLFNDRNPAKARFLYNGFGLTFAASEFATATTPQARINAVSAFAIFEASLRRDLRHTLHFSTFTDRETNFGGSIASSVYFGGKRNRQRRKLRVRNSLSVSWLNRSGLDQSGGVRLNESLRLIHDNRKFTLWPERGHSISVGVSASQTVRVDGATDHRFVLGLDAGWSQLWRIAHHHVIATRLQASMGLPLRSELEFRSLQRAGGNGGLAGFGGNELFGRAVAMGRMEYRHVWVDDLRIPALNLMWLRTIGGALFGGVATVSPCERIAGWFGRGTWYGQVGYGLTARLQILGVTPQFFRLDVAVPIGRKTGRTCLGETFPGYLAEVQGRPPEDAQGFLVPYSIYINFTQPF